MCAQMATRAVARTTAITVFQAMRGYGQGAKAVLFETDLLHLSLSLSNQAGGY